MAFPCPSLGTEAGQAWRRWAQRGFPGWETGLRMHLQEQRSRSLRGGPFALGQRWLTAPSSSPDQKG